MTTRILPCLGLALMLVPLQPARAEWPLTSDSTLRLATVEEGREALSRRDDFIERLSPFDRAARMRSGLPVGEKELLRHAAAQVRAWSDSDRDQLAPIVKRLAGRMAAYDLPLPPEVLLVKTTGLEEEGAAGYCRGNAVVLPEASLGIPMARFEKLLAHELFHVVSKQNPAWRERLYALVGFRPCPEVEYPDALAGRRITNPDAPRCDFFAELTINGRPQRVVPILYASAPRYDPRVGGTLFAYLTFRLMAVEPDGDRWRPVLQGGRPVLYDAQNVPDYHAKVGRNTPYIIHPEEVLADNFALLTLGRRNVPTPQLQAALEKELKRKK